MRQNDRSNNPLGRLGTRLFTGPGATMLRTPFGGVVRFNGVAADFSHPWMATLSSQSGATFLRATINNVPATIRGVPVEGSSKKPVPTLTWKTPMLSKDGIG